MNPEPGRQREPKFDLGRVVATQGALDKLDNDSMFEALSKHERGIWGDLDVEDKLANEDALERGGRLVSAYHDSAETKFYIITEADRSCTTVLLPSEY